MREIIVAGNWKMHKDVREAEAFTRELLPKVLNLKKTKIILCPPFTALFNIGKIVEGTGIAIGGQNMYFTDNGAFTGEVSGRMLQSTGCEYVILGHSERRHIFGETDEMVQKKVAAALRLGLRPIICIGETLAERQAEKTLEVIEHQLNAALEMVDANQIVQCVLAYEPVWAIGTGVNATPGQAAEVHQQIRQILTAKYGFEVANAITIQYGGSVKPDNAAELIREAEIDGFLVGGASLKSDDFSQIAAIVEKIKNPEE